MSLRDKLKIVPKCKIIFSAPGLTEKLDRGFQFRPEFMTLAQKTLADVVKKHLAKQKNEKKKKKKKNKELTFVGIHSR